MAQKSNENFRQYAKRWRDPAAQIQPPIPKHELKMMFMNTLRGTLLDRMLNHSTRSFGDMVMTEEMFEVAIKSGRIEEGDE
ncbi:hypothetical protein GQ457_04G023800 [Hibiscus cannabinus]